jgi:hypothetical protein
MSVQGETHLDHVGGLSEVGQLGRMQMLAHVSIHNTELESHSMHDWSMVVRKTVKPLGRCIS